MKILAQEELRIRGAQYRFILREYKRGYKYRGVVQYKWARWSDSYRVESNNLESVKRGLRQYKKHLSIPLRTWGSLFSRPYILIAENRTLSDIDRL